MSSKYITTNGEAVASPVPRCQTKKEAYTFDYPEAIAFADAQNSVQWYHHEIHVEKDIQDIRVNMTPAEAHGVITTLKLFTLYELVAGNEYWGGRFKRMFPRHDFRQMGNSFSFAEINIHAPFYNKINEALMLNTDEFYTSYVNDPVLKARMEFVESIVNDKDDLVSLGAFSMVEGGILYSAFAYLKHFQTLGKNKLLNVVRGINFSVRDENLHCEGGAWAFLTLLREKEALGLMSGNDYNKLVVKLHVCARQILEHESYIIDMLFSQGDIENINAEDLKTFVKSRLNLCLANLKVPALFEVGKNPIAEWFYENINGLKFHDFFTGTGSEYHRSWSENDLKWVVETYA
ncbi:ribonucleotide reductase [Vibrio phage phi 3]|uniref:ribonucleoside-diphosphate reductase n=1 Tax=Vibrio phage phi 3 TaxID=1589298 RepID=A0A0B5GYS4_9CAUD|nr:ribonucleotide reductase [Vibrio phage phi 3]AJF40856.1 hypothetical protein SBVP3_0089 [Vibrio phage phi 3]